MNHQLIEISETKKIKLTTYTKDWWWN